MQRIALAAGSLNVELLPELGGSVGSFQMRREDSPLDLLRPWNERSRSAAHAVDTAMFPMIPYANRIAGNQFGFRGVEYRLAPNYVGEPLAIHGTAWLQPWTVEDCSERTVRLSFSDPARFGPHSYRAVQEFALSALGLTVRLAVTNTGTAAMPFGMGLHPWWIRDKGTTVQFKADRFWLEGPGHLATDPISIPPELRFDDGREIPLNWRDNCYSGWTGTAVVNLVAREAVMQIQASSVFRHLMMYCDPAREDFCLEPQSHACGAFNRIADAEYEPDGLVVLDPGRSLQGSISFIAVDARKLGVPGR